MKQSINFLALFAIIILSLNSCSKEDKSVNVEGVTLNKNSMTLVEEESETLIVNITPNNADNKTCSWSSSNPNIAKVDETGKVTAIKKGETTITVTTLDGNKTASCHVTVEAKYIAATNIKLSDTSISLHAGESYKVTAEVTPQDATDKTITWSSSDETIATVDDQGNIKALIIGNAKITASIEKGTIKATCDVIIEPIAVTGVSLSSKSMSLLIDDEEQLEYKITPSNADDKSVTWTIDDTSIAKIDDNGKVTALKVGQTTVTIKTTDGGYTDQCTINVVDISELVEGSVSKVGDVVINGVVFPSNKLIVELTNNSKKTIIVNSVQIINGDTNAEGNVMDIGVSVGEKQTISYIITLGQTINNPIVRWRYSYNNSEFILDCKLKN